MLHMCKLDNSNHFLIYGVLTKPGICKYINQMKAQALLDVTVHSLLLPMNNCDVSGSKKKINGICILLSCVHSTFSKYTNDVLRG